MKTLSLKTWTYQFSDAKNSLWTIPFAHALMAIVFLGAGIFTARLGLNIFIPIFFAVAFSGLDLKNTKSVHVVSALYFALCMFELIFIGVPDSPVAYSLEATKGAFFIIIMNILPWVYIVLKFGLGIVLINFMSVLKSAPKK